MKSKDMKSSFLQKAEKTGDPYLDKEMEDIHVHAMKEINSFGQDPKEKSPQPASKNSEYESIQHIEKQIKDSFNRNTKDLLGVNGPSREQQERDQTSYGVGKLEINEFQKNKIGRLESLKFSFQKKNYIKDVATNLGNRGQLFEINGKQYVKFFVPDEKVGPNDKIDPSKTKNFLVPFDVVRSNLRR